MPRSVNSTTPTSASPAAPTATSNAARDVAQTAAEFGFGGLTKRVAALVAELWKRDDRRTEREPEQNAPHKARQPDRTPIPDVCR
jgi:hypothetical protein